MIHLFAQMLTKIRLSTQILIHYSGKKKKEKKYCIIMFFLIILNEKK